MEKITDIFDSPLILNEEFDLLHNMIIETEYNLENFKHLAEYWKFLNSAKLKSFADHLRFERYKSSCNEKLHSCAMHICYLKYKQFSSMP